MDYFDLHKKNIERSYSITDDNILDILGGEQSTSGIVVTPAKILDNPFFLKGIRLIADKVSSLPLILYHNQKIGKVRAKEHPLYFTLKKQVSPYVSIDRLLNVCVWQAIMHGNSYAEIVRTGAGIELYHINSEDITPIKERRRLAYVHNENGHNRIIQPEDILHFRSNLGNSTELGGFALCDIAKNTLGSILQLDRFTQYFWRNNAQNGMVLEFPTPFADDTARHRFRQDYLRNHQGVKQSHLPLILEGGAKATSLQIDAEKNQLLQSQEFQKDKCAAILGIPASFLESKNRVSYSSLKEDTQNLLSGLNSSWLCPIENEISLKLFSEVEKRSDSLSVSFKREALLQSDPQVTSTMVREEYLADLITQEEARAIKDMPVETEGTFFSDRLVEKIPEVEPPPPKEADQLTEMTRSTIQRMFNVISRSSKPLQDHRELFISSLNVYDKEKVEEFYSTLEDEIESALPEQKKTILQNKNIDQIIEVIK